MKSFFTILIFFNLHSFSAEKLKMNKTCQFPKCLNSFVTSKMNLKAAYEKYDKDGNQHQEIYIPLRGKFKNSANIYYEVLVEAFVGGMRDGINIHLLGFHNNGDLVLQTNRGPLFLSKDSLKINCNSCIKFIDAKSGKILKNFNLPSQIGDPIRIANFRFSADRNLYYIYNKQCIELNMDQLFKETPLEQCQKYISAKTLKLAEPTPKMGSLPKNIQIVPKLKRELFFELFQSEKLNYLIYAQTKNPADT